MGAKTWMLVLGPSVLKERLAKYPPLDWDAAIAAVAEHFPKVKTSPIEVFHAMHSAVDWFAMAKWSSGTLLRSLSLAPDNGIIEDLGTRLPFEAPYWAGRHPAVDPEDEDDGPCPFPFHPLELGEGALRSLFGYQLEGYVDASPLVS